MAFINRRDIYRPAVDSRVVNGRLMHKKRFRWNGEKRPPRKGEWFLSGSLIEAYYSPSDMTEHGYPHFIAVETDERCCPRCGQLLSR